MNSRLIILASILVLLVGWWAIKGGGGSSKPPQKLAHITAKCANADCGNEFTVDLPSDFERFGEFPRNCTKCNQKTAYQMVVCGGCQTHYPNNESRDHLTKCTKCGAEIPGE